MSATLFDLADFILQILFDFDLSEEIGQSVLNNSTSYFGQEFALSWIATISVVLIVDENVSSEEIPLKKQLIKFLLIATVTFFYTKIGFMFVEAKIWFIIHALLCLLSVLIHCVIYFYKWYKRTESKIRTRYIVETIRLFIVMPIAAVIMEKLGFNSFGAFVVFVIIIGALSYLIRGFK